MKKFDVITEVKNKKNANEIEIFIYKLAVRDIDNKHKENYSVALNLSRKNKLDVSFSGQLIGSFEDISDWGEYTYIEKNHRTINLESYAERELLERLLLMNIVSSVDTSKYTVKKKDIYMKDSVYNNHNILIYRYFKIDVRIDSKGNIVVGYDVKHSFDYKHTLDVDIKNDTIKPGDKVKDCFHETTYEYVGLAPFTVSEKNDYMGISIKEYYQNKNQGYILKSIPDNTQAVLVKSKKDIFPYIPSRLKKYCRFENLPSVVLSDFKHKVRQKTNEKMTFTVEEILNILSYSKHIEACTKNMIASELGYKVLDLGKPGLVFGNNKVGYYPSRELLNPRVGAFTKKDITISYFLDPNIAKNTNEVAFVHNFCLELEKVSKNIGITLNRQQVGDKVKFNEINIDNEDNFKYDLKKAISNFDNSTIIILEDEHLKKYYTTIKKTFGNQNNIPTQCISLKTIRSNNSNDKARQSLILNILLGIYGKNGIQPWILKKNLNSDCFIGLDVSREDKVNKAGIVQVIGCDGRVLQAKVVSSSQSGEQIKLETLKEIVFEAVAAYESTYNRKPRHITFHRDGINREELENLKETTNTLGIQFDYIEVTKNINRRIATLSVEDSQRVWKADMGKCYLKDNYAFVCTTSPHESMGMAQPIRIKQVYGVLDIQKVVEDVYNLTFMHIGATNKTRLPITTYYADLSSTYGNRELMPSNLDSNALHFL